MSGDDQSNRAGEDQSNGTPGDGNGYAAASSDVSEAALPADVVDEVERLTRFARRAVDDAETAAYREAREDLLAERGFVSRTREDEDGIVLVCHPAEWLEAGSDAEDADGSAGDEAEQPIDPERIDDVSRATELHLDGASTPDDWAAVAERNRAVADAVRREHGDVHGANAVAFAEFASNHYAKPLAAITATELEQFQEEYYERNVWPTEEQATALDRSLELCYEELAVPRPDV